MLQNIYKINVLPVHKKSDEQSINNYRPVSLFPTYTKSFEKGLFDSIFKYLDKQINNNQSGFHRGDSHIHQLLSIIHIIYKTFEANPLSEVKGISLDLSKAFDRVCQDGLLLFIKWVMSNGLIIIDQYCNS